MDPSEALKNLLGPVALTASLFPPTSRYYGIATAEYRPSAGPPIRYLLRRFVPNSELFAPMQEHYVKDRDRLDNIAAFYLGDPEQFWRIADANRAMRPEALTERPGTRLHITLPQGIPAPTPLLNDRVAAARRFHGTASGGAVTTENPASDATCTTSEVTSFNPS